MIVIFDQTKVPRSLSKEKWKETYRWVRVQRQEQQRQNEELRKMLPMVSGKRKEDILDRLIYPPILLGPFQE